MCLLVLKRTADSRFTNNQFKNMIARNADGFGMMWIEGGRIRTARSVGTPAEKFKIFQEHRGKATYAMHARMRTHGLINEANCHPYEILNMDKGDPCDMYMMHNGVLHDAPSIDKDMSDTWHFVEYILKPIIKADPDMVWDNEHIQKLITKVIGGSKLLLMRSGNTKYNILTFNSQLGTEIDKCWHSNAYGADPLYVSKTSDPWSSRNNYHDNNWRQGSTWNYKTKQFDHPDDRHITDVDDYSLYGDGVYCRDGKYDNKDTDVKDFTKQGSIYLPDNSKDDKIIPLASLIQRREEDKIITQAEKEDLYILTCTLQEMRSLSDAALKDYMRAEPDGVADVILGLYRKNTMSYEKIVALLKTPRGLEDMVNLIRKMEVIGDKGLSSRG